MLKRLKLLLQSLHLFDSWRFLNPEGRNFTHFSVPHSRNARLDYLFVSQRDLEKLDRAHIGTQTFSDHAPISMSMRLADCPQKRPSWRLNASLLTDPNTLPVVTDGLKEFFRLNATEGSDPLTVWEAHKCSIRGILISLGAKKKREREAALQQLVTKITALEALHKQSLSVSLATSLLEARRDLQQLLDSTAKRMLFFKL